MIARSDVLVVGAGPAGSAAAFFLARAGVSVLMVDRAVFPRDKVCGDGLGVSCHETLAAMGLDGWIRERGPNVSRRFLLSSPDGTSAVVRSAEGIPDVYTLPRFELDAALVWRAVEAGAGLCEGTEALELVRGGGMARLTALRDGKETSFEAPLVIVADGGPASLTRRLGLAPKPAEWVAVRAYYEGDRGDPDQLEIHWERAVMPGYGWVFPLGSGVANVGIGAYARDVHRHHLHLEQLLETFLEANPHARARLGGGRRTSRVRGYPLRADAPDVRPWAENVLLAGESAGVVSPLTGEGIGPALRCGRLAAEHAVQALERGDVTAASLAAYGRAFHRLFDGHHKAARLLRAALSRPWILNRAVARATSDDDWARLLYDVIAGAESPRAVLTPRALWKLLGPTGKRPRSPRHDHPQTTPHTA